MRTGSSEGEVALIVGGGRGISSSCAKLFSREGMRVAVAARQPDKPVLMKLEKEHGIHRFPCDAASADSVAALFGAVEEKLGAPHLVVHNIDGRFAEIFRKDITEAEPAHVAKVFENSAFSAFLVGQQAARCMRERPMSEGGHWVGRPTEDDNMADPNHIAETYLHLHRQHRSTWAFEVALRPWNERW